MQKVDDERAALLREFTKERYDLHTRDWWIAIARDLLDDREADKAEVARLTKERDERPYRDWHNSLVNELVGERNALREWYEKYQNMVEVWFPDARARLHRALGVGENESLERGIEAAAKLRSDLERMPPCVHPEHVVGDDHGNLVCLLAKKANLSTEYPGF